MKPSLTVAASLFLAAGASSQSWSWPLDPRAAYLRTNSDTPTAPLILNLGSLGIEPGDWLRIETTGACRQVGGGQDTVRAACAVFSSSATLLATNVQQRVPGAIAAGPAFPSVNTYFGSVPTDITEDFYVSRTLWADHVDVQVPAGASHLFIANYDSYYVDNADPNGDYGVSVTKLAAPTFGGTGEHIVMKAAVNGTPASLPDVHLAPPGSTITAQLEYPLGFADGSLYLFLADVVPVGGAVPNPLPGLWCEDLIVLKGGLLPSTPDFTDTWSLVVAPGSAGIAVFVQCAALTPTARNGLFETTNAHAFLFQ